MDLKDTFQTTIACRPHTGDWCCVDRSGEGCCDKDNSPKFYLNPGTLTYIRDGLSTVLTRTRTITSTVTRTITDAPDADTITVTDTVTTAGDAVTSTVTRFGTNSPAEDIITVTVTSTITAALSAAGTTTIIIATGSGLTSTFSSCATAQPASSSVPQAVGNSLAPGAIAGLAVGVAVPTILAVMFAALWWVERYKRKHLESMAGKAGPAAPVFLAPPVPPPAPAAPPPVLAPGPYGMAGGGGGSLSGAGGASQPPMLPIHLAPAQLADGVSRGYDGTAELSGPEASELPGQSNKLPRYYDYN
ncbi:hypothetical protein DRE_00057 [Drechslerella stenobrocha 248]|uniref:Uncharacterized protein n=1 Tax=Drechslerella stenobrocha 248 TaxID=1043628 RepID=W7I9I7_9PEZI|nr:hypothetical protein DRE_00057 [Drechslerella stenobrocha 248]